MIYGTGIVYLEHSELVMLRSYTSYIRDLLRIVSVNDDCWYSKLMHTGY